MKEAGFASGKYEGDEEILMVGANADPGKAQAEVAKAQLEKLGFKIRLRTVPQDAVYTEWCQVPAKKVAMCGGAGWFKDFDDPQSMLEPTFKGSIITKEGGNNNLAQLNDPKIDEAMDKAALLEGDERLKAWGDIDKMIIEQAPAVPFVWDKTTLIHVEERERRRATRTSTLVRPLVHLDQVGTASTTITLRPAPPCGGRPSRTITAHRMAAYIVRRLLWTAPAAVRRQRSRFLIFNVLPTADPARCARAAARRRS